MIDSDALKPEQTLAYIIDNRPVSAVFICAGSAQALNYAFRIIDKGGRIVLVGDIKEKVLINPLLLLSNEQEIIGSISYHDEFLEAIELFAQRQIQIREIITDQVPLEDALGKGFDALLCRERRHIKILVTTN